MSSKPVAVPRSFTQVVMDGSKSDAPHKWADVDDSDCEDLQRSSSECSLSTTECASSSGCSSGGSPAGSTGAVSLPSFDNDTSPGVQNRSIHVAPFWVDNGLKGEESAWLLVFPKAGAVLKSPNDAVLLGPYVKTKNTFLDECRIGGDADQPRRRALSLGAQR